MEDSEIGRSPAVDTSIKVRYAETDAQRVVYHGEYVVWFEVGRTEYCERAGYPYPRMEAEDDEIPQPPRHAEQLRLL